MTEDVFSVTTPFADVAELAQGYVNRVDGAQILLPLSAPLGEGEGVRFVVHLADGTPAFAGAGRCIQVSDQGDQVAPEHRFEVLCDSLQFDERSQPVYDYIVTIRSAMLAEQPETQASQEETVDQGLVADEIEAAALAEEAALEAVQEEPTVIADASYGEVAGAAGDTEEQPEYGQADEMDALQIEHAPEAYQRPEYAIPSIIPKGLLSRPALAVHWRPEPPEPPQPSPSSGLFRYNGEGLPRPAQPPFPELDPAYYVQPAPRPGSEPEQAQSAPDEAVEEAYTEAQDSLEVQGDWTDDSPQDVGQTIPPEADYDQEVEASAALDVDNPEGYDLEAGEDATVIAPYAMEENEEGVSDDAMQAAINEVHGERGPEAVDVDMDLESER